MRKSRFMASLESEDIIAEPVDAVEAENPENVEAAVAEVETADQDIELDHQTVEEMEADAETLEESADVIEETVEAGEEVPPVAARLAEITVESICNKYGMARQNRYSLEDFGNSKTNIRASMELVAEARAKVSEIYEAIKKWFREQGAKIAEFFKRIFTARGRLKARVTKLLQVVEEQAKNKEPHAGGKVIAKDEGMLSSVTKYFSTKPKFTAGDAVKASAALHDFSKQINSAKSAYLKYIEKNQKEAAEWMAKALASTNTGDATVFEKSKDGLKEVLSSMRDGFENVLKFFTRDGFSNSELPNMPGKSIYNFNNEIFKISSLKLIKHGGVEKREDIGNLLDYHVELTESPKKFDNLEVTSLGVNDMQKILSDVKATLEASERDSNKDKKDLDDINKSALSVLDKIEKDSKSGEESYKWLKNALQKETRDEYKNIAAMYRAGDRVIVNIGKALADYCQISLKENEKKSK